MWMKQLYIYKINKKTSSLSESESKSERVISSFFMRETLLECMARNKAVTSVLNSYLTRTWLTDSSHSIILIFLLFKHTVPTKLTSTDGSTMSSNANFRSPKSEAFRRRCETSPLQNDAGGTPSMGLVTDQWGGSLVWWLIDGRGGDWWSDLFMWVSDCRVGWLIGFVVVVGFRLDWLCYIFGLIWYLGL